MDIEALRAFIFVVETGSISQAAEKLKFYRLMELDYRRKSSDMWRWARQLFYAYGVR